DARDTPEHAQPRSSRSSSAAVFFLQALPPTPTSTLFPYTTLFRSHLKKGRPAQATVALEKAKRRAPDKASIREAHAASPSRARRDRKSTRLNSSHVAISYAVFCLKKKKR